MTDGLLITGDIKEDEESVPRSVEPTDKVSHETKIVITGTETNEEENSVGIDITENKPGTDITENQPGDGKPQEKSTTTTAEINQYEIMSTEQNVAIAEVVVEKQETSNEENNTTNGSSKSLTDPKDINDAEVENKKVTDVQVTNDINGANVE